MEHQKERAFHLVGEHHNGLRLDRCISQVFEGLSRRKARALIGDGKVWVNGRPIRVLSRPVYTGDRITWLHADVPEVLSEVVETKPPEVSTSRDESESVGAESTSGLPEMTFPETPPVQPDRSRRHHKIINWDAHGGKPTFLFRDKYLAVVDKMSGIPTEPTPKEDLRICLRQVEAVLREEGLHPRRVYVAAVHRLDAQASGALAFALRKQAAAELSSQFAIRSAGRLYRALVVGRVEADEGTLRHHLSRVGPGIRQGVVPEGRGKHAITHFRVLERFADATLVECKLETGRTHQIRVQMGAMGHPLLGDWLYLPEEDVPRNPAADRLMLHAISLTLTHPKTQERMTFDAPLPEDFSLYLQSLQTS